MNQTLTLYICMKTIKHTSLNIIYELSSLNDHLLIRIKYQLSFKFKKI